MRLFDKGTINGLTLKNRVIRSATWEGMCDPQGRPSARLIALYRALATGEVGLIISGYTYVRTDGKQLPGKMGLDSETQVPELTRLTAAVHQAGGRIFCQLVHAGGLAAGEHALAPSAVKEGFPAIPRAMSPQDIHAIVAAFAAAAGRARRAGFDGVQLHGAHGYLINQFLSPLTNQRQDAYGGSLKNRSRFLREVYQAVRAEVGPDYPVTIKLTASDNLPGGFLLEEAVSVAQDLASWGIDAIEVSSGTAASGDQGPARTQIDAPQQEAYNATCARRIKQAIAVPVSVVGGIRSSAVAESLLESGTADFVSLSRPLIREPDLVRKWRLDPTYTAQCISCNGCFRPGLKEGGIRCVID